MFLASVTTFSGILGDGSIESKIISIQLML